MRFPAISAGAKSPTSGSITKGVARAASCQLRKEYT